jgi:hydrophobe/amphiphile efflux-3 (HAE3) family protein
MLEKYANFIVRYRIYVIILFVLATGAVASSIPDIEVDADVKSMLPPDLPARLNINKIEELFGGTEMVMLVMTTDDILKTDSLKRLKKISRQMERVKNIDKVLSLFTLKDIRSEDGQLIVDPSVKRIPKNDKAREKLRQSLKDNEMVYGNVVSKDFKAVATIGLLRAGAKDPEVVADLLELIEKIPGPEKLSIAGMPYIRTNVSRDIMTDMRKFLPLGLLIILIFLFFCFKQIRGVLLPFLVVVMSILFGLGLIPLLGWKIQMVTVILPVILIAVANDYGIHILARYQEDNLPNSDITPKELAKIVICQLFSPVIVTGITTAAGLLCLLTHIIIPSKQLGILAAAAVAFALIGSVTFIPAVLALLPKSKPIMGLEKTKLRPLEILLRKTAEFVVKRPITFVITSIIIVAIVTTGINSLVVDTNPIHYYDEDSPVAQSADLVDEHFGGSGSIAIVAHGNIKDPKVLNKIDQVEKKLANLDEVGYTSSIAKIVRQMNRVLDDESEKPDRIPETLEAVAQYFLLYSMNGDPEDFERMVDFDYENAVITARINTLSTETVKRVTTFIDEELKNYPKETFPMVGGFLDVLAVMVDAIVEGQISSLILSLILVSLLVMLLFRSFMAGLFAAIPLSLSMALLFGLMGYFNIELNAATAMLSSIMIGVGVDYTIHYMWRHRQECRSGYDHREAIRITLTTTGRGIVFNAFSVMIGFSIVLLSNFLPVKFFGFLVVVSIGACLIGALGILPALALIFKPKFLKEHVR